MTPRRFRHSSPFGHGLSYTTFTYGKPVASAKTMAADGTLTVTVAVKNTGSIAGKEIVQLYVGDDKCSVLRPVKELKHFAKVALAPGEEKSVTFTLTPDDLKFYDELPQLGSTNRVSSRHTFALRLPTSVV